LLLPCKLLNQGDFEPVNDVAIQAVNEGATRTSRKRERTRGALISAARDLVFERGHERISIQDITERADVGLGTFYNYFATKAEVFEAVIEDMRAAFNAELDAMRQPLKDPAFIVAVTLKHCFRQAQDNKDWNTFLAYSGLEGEYLLHQDEEQLLADLKRGAAAGRFKIEDPQFARTLIMGMVRHVNREIRAGRLGRKAMDDATQYVLRMLGLPDLVARALVQSPMPATAPARRAAPISSRG